MLELSPAPGVSVDDGPPDCDVLTASTLSKYLKEKLEVSSIDKTRINNPYFFSLISSPIKKDYKSKRF